MTARRILVAGIGNVFLGDDGFGVEVARRLAARGVPANVRVMDAGIRGFDLAYALGDGYDAAILVDVTRRGAPAGSLHVLEIEAPAAPADLAGVLDTHAMVPERVLALAQLLGATPPRVYLVGCEAESFGGDDDVTVGLGVVATAAVEGAIALVDALIARISGDGVMPGVAANA